MDLNRWQKSDGLRKCRRYAISFVRSPWSSNSSAILSRSRSSHAWGEILSSLLKERCSVLSETFKTFAKAGARYSASSTILSQLDNGVAFRKRMLFFTVMPTREIHPTFQD